MKSYLEYSQTNRPTTSDFVDFRETLHKKNLSRSTINNYSFAIKKYHAMWGEQIEYTFLKRNDEIPYYFDEEDVLRIFSVVHNIKHLAMLQTIFDGCASTTWPFTIEDSEGPIPKKLKVDDAHAEYLEYCKLFNITTPAEKVPFGKYIGEKYQVYSTMSSEMVEGEKVTYRYYYPQLYLVKSAKAIYAEIKMAFTDNDTTGNHSNTTDLPQKWGIGNSSSRDNTTDTTVKVLSGVIKEIEKMYKFISSCKNERDITYENYLKSQIFCGICGIA